MQPAEGIKMKAAVVLQYGQDNPKVQFRDNWLRPIRKTGKGQLLVRVLACSLAMGDIHLLSGRVRSILSIEGGFPYIPGLAVCGVIEEADQGSKFKKGDIVAASKSNFIGGIAQYCITQQKKTVLKPESVSILDAAACVDSSVTAQKAVQLARIKPGDRVLVLGGSGGVGSSVVQLAKLHEPSFLAATSTQKALVEALGANQVIDYRQKNWWEQYKRNHFDVIIDCVGGNGHYDKSVNALKDRKHNGRFVAVVGDEPNPKAEKWYQAVKFGLGMIKRPLSSKINSSIPEYIAFVSDTDHESLGQILNKMANKQLRILLEERTPFQFSQQGVKQALQLQASHHAHGKIVIKIGDL